MHNNQTTHTHTSKRGLVIFPKRVGEKWVGIIDSLTFSCCMQRLNRVRLRQDSETYMYTRAPLEHDIGQNKIFHKEMNYKHHSHKMCIKNRPIAIPFLAIEERHI